MYFNVFIPAVDRRLYNTFIFVSDLRLMIMKKIMLLPLLALLFSCSADDNLISRQNEGDTSSVTYYDNVDGFIEKAGISPSCINLGGSVSADVSNGLGNPVLNFTTIVNGTVVATKKFKVRLEVQALSDCDDMTSSTGSVVVFGPAGTVQNVQANPPSFSVMPSQLPLCYKWRIVFDDATDGARGSGCYSYTAWYESPLL